MKKKIISLALLILTFFQPVESIAEGLQIHTGFYVNSQEGQNTYIDIYSYLNNKQKALEIITNSGFKNTLFVHQIGRGFTLEELMLLNSNESVDNILRDLSINDFSSRYIDLSSNKTIEVIPPLYKGEIELEPSWYDIPKLSNEFIDVLKREYPEFLYNIEAGWKNSLDTDIVKEQKIVDFLNDLKLEVEAQGIITESNFDRIMYTTFKKVIMYKRHLDFRNALINSYGSQIDYSDRNKKLHPDLIPLSESIKGAVLNNYFTLLYDIKGLQINKETDQQLKDLIYEEIGDINAITYEIIDIDGVNYYEKDRGIYNTRINDISNGDITVIKVNDKELKPNFKYGLKLHPYIKDNMTDITSTTSDFDPLTCKVKILDENGQVIEDIIEEVLIYNMTQGTVAKQELQSNQMISYIYISTQNPKDDFEIYFKTINQKWYKLTLTNYSSNQYLVNEFIRGEMR